MRLVRIVASHGLEEQGHGQLAVLVYAHIEKVVGVRLVLQPRAVVGYDRGAVGGHLGLVGLLIIINAGGTDYLRNDDALRAVDDKGAAGSHEREVAHEYLLLFNLLCLAVAQPHADLQRGGVCGVARLALLDGVLGLVVHGVVDKAQLQISGVVGDGLHVPENLAQTRVKEPLVGLLLYLQQVRHVLDLCAPGEALSQRLPVVNVLWHHALSFGWIHVYVTVHPAALLDIHCALLLFSENLIE